MHTKLRTHFKSVNKLDKNGIFHLLKPAISNNTFYTIFAQFETEVNPDNENYFKIKGANFYIENFLSTKVNIGLESVTNKLELYFDESICEFVYLLKIYVLPKGNQKGLDYIENQNLTPSYEVFKSVKHSKRVDFEDEYFNKNIIFLVDIVDIKNENLCGIIYDSNFELRNGDNITDVNTYKYKGFDSVKNTNALFNANITPGTGTLKSENCHPGYVKIVL